MTSTILQVSGLTSTAPDGTTLLDDVSFTVETGWLVAVVGPTGAGKTSLAKALLGQLPNAAGTVEVTGPEHEHGGRRGRVAGVPQEDATHPQLTLRRTLEHAAALRVGTSVSQRRASVDQVLAELGLTSRAGTRLADLSGGERKRANVAVELVGQPDLLVLDEPTAGLDPGFEKSVFTHLRAMADRGRTIVAITHSMRVLGVCDRVLFLAPGGTVAFFGTPSEAEAYFDWDDPVDAYAALATKPAASWKKRFAAHQARPAAPARRAVRSAAWSAPSRPSQTASGPPSPSSPAAAMPHHIDSTGHLGTLLHRALHVASSDRRALLLSLAAGPVVGFLLWAVLPGGTLRPPDASEGETMASAPKAMTFAFFLAMTITWLAAAGAAREVVKERHILEREQGVGVALSTYLAGKAMFLSGFAVLQVIPLAAITLISQQLPGSGPALGSGIVEVMVVSILVGVAAVTTGLLVSSWASSSEKAMTALPVVLVAQLALAGPWSENRGPILDVVRQVIPTKWAADAVAATVLGDGSRWWTAAGALAAIAAVQLGGALVLLRRSSPSTDNRRDRIGSVSAVGSRLATSQPLAIRFLPAGVALVLAVAAGFGAVGRAGGGATDAPAVALPAPPTTAAPTPPPAPVPAAPAPAPAAAATPAPTAAPTTTAAPVRSAPLRTPVTAAPRTAAPAPTTPPTTRPATPPTTARPTPTTAPPAATAPADPLAFSNWLLQQIFQPVRR